MPVAGVAMVEEVGAGTLEVTFDAGADLRCELAALTVNRDWGLLEMRSLEMSLEEVFLQLTTEEERSRTPALGYGQSERNQGRSAP